MEDSEFEKKQWQALQYWINSFPSQYCALVSSRADLLDGRSIWDIVRHIIRENQPLNWEQALRTMEASRSTNSPAGRIQGALCTLAEVVGWNKLPELLRSPQCAYRIYSDHRPSMLALLFFLRDMHLSSSLQQQQQQRNSQRRVVTKTSRDGSFAMDEPHPRRSDEEDVGDIMRESDLKYLTHIVNEHNRGKAEDNSTLDQQQKKSQQRRLTERAARYKQREAGKHRALQNRLVKNRHVVINAEGMRLSKGSMLDPTYAHIPSAATGEKRRETNGLRSDIKVEIESAKDGTMLGRATSRRPQLDSSRSPSAEPRPLPVPAQTAAFMRHKSCIIKTHCVSPSEDATTVRHRARSLSPKTADCRRRTTNSGGIGESVRVIREGPSVKSATVLAPQNDSMRRLHRWQTGKTEQMLNDAADVPNTAELSVHDSVSVRRKNEILFWAQCDLGIIIDEYVPYFAVKRTSAICVTGEKENHSNLCDEGGISKQSNEDTEYSQPTYLGRVTGKVPKYLCDRVDSEVYRLWKSSGGTTTRLGSLRDPWINGLFLSEVLASLTCEKGRVKKVAHYDRYGQEKLVAKLVLQGTVASVHSKAQALQNLRTCLTALVPAAEGECVWGGRGSGTKSSAHITASQGTRYGPLLLGFACPREFNAEDIFYGKISLWQLLDKLYTFIIASGTPRSYRRGPMHSIGASTSRSQNQQNKILEKCRRAARAISLSPDEGHFKMSELDRESLQTESTDKGTRSRAAGTVRFDSKVDNVEKASRNFVANRKKNGPGTESNYIEAKTNGSVKGKISSVAVSSMQKRDPSKAIGKAEAAAGATKSDSFPTNPAAERYDVLDMPEDRKHPPFSGTPVRKYRMGFDEHKHPASMNEDDPENSTGAFTVARVRRVEMMKERSRVKQKNRKQRKESLQHILEQQQQPAQFGSETNGAVEHSTEGDVNSTRGRSYHSHLQRTLIHSRSRKLINIPGNWAPPCLTATERCAVEDSPISNISAAQQNAVNEWLRTLQLPLREGEGGYYSSHNPRMLGSDQFGGAPSNFKQLDRVQPHEKVINVPPLPLAEDRVRNGEMLAYLLYRLEPDAASHANLSRLIHRCPKVLDQCLENIDKCLFLFKIRRSPPIPLHLLCQPEAVIRGEKNICWNLLWEIMQAYPLINDQYYRSVVDFGNLTDFPKNFAYYRSKSHSNADGGRDSSIPPSYMCYNYDDPEMAAVGGRLHMLPYSMEQRRLLDLSIIDWLDQCGCIVQIVGNLCKPASVISLESYIKDGTLLCRIVGDVLQIPLDSSWNKNPHTYSQCISNIRKCIDALRRTPMMRSRYLYGGVEEDIGRGSWDSILGLLEDMHRYHDRKFADGSASNRQLIHNAQVHSHASFDEHQKQGHSDEVGQALDRLKLAQAIVSESRTAQERFMDSKNESKKNDIDGIEQHTLLPSKKGLSEQFLTRDFDLVPGNAFSNRSTVTFASYDASDVGGSMQMVPTDEHAPYLGNIKKSSMDAGRSGVDFPGSRFNSNFGNTIGRMQKVSLHMHELPSSTQNDVHCHNPSSDDTTAFKGVSLEACVSEKAYDDITEQQASSSAELYPTSDVLGGNMLRASNTSTHLIDRYAADDLHCDKQIPVVDEVEREARQQALSLPPVSNNQVNDLRFQFARENLDAVFDNGNTSSVGINQASMDFPSYSALEMTSAQDPSVTLRYNIQPKTIMAGTSSSMISTDSLQEAPSPDLSRTKSRNLADEDYELSPAPRVAPPSPARTTFGELQCPASVTSAVSAVVDSIDVRLHRPDVRSIVKWLTEHCGLTVPTSADRGDPYGLQSADVFTDGVILYQLVEKLERCQLAGVSPCPTTAAMKAQNVRRSLDQLRKRKTRIPLSLLSCADAIVAGDLDVTVKLLSRIKKEYAMRKI